MQIRPHTACLVFCLLYAQLGKHYVLCRRLKIYRKIPCYSVVEIDCQSFHYVIRSFIVFAHRNISIGTIGIRHIVIWVKRYDIVEQVNRILIFFSAIRISAFAFKAESVSRLNGYDFIVVGIRKVILILVVIIFCTVGQSVDILWISLERSIPVVESKIVMTQIKVYIRPLPVSIGYPLLVFLQIFYCLAKIIQSVAFLVVFFIDKPHLVICIPVLGMLCHLLLEVAHSTILVGLAGIYQLHTSLIVVAVFHFFQLLRKGGNRCCHQNNCGNSLS